jgi:ABC-type transport system involved in multi-copper enzyme maturation permease subunit
MSAQTGIETPRSPASERMRDRVRHRFLRWRSEPNPLWMREMRQMVRLMRTPVVMMVITILLSLLISSIGGVLAGWRSPEEVGSALYQVFFSLAYFVVTLIGPALAANSIASEREGHTWEAVLLTGLRPEEVARGKLLSAYTAIATYIVALAPVGALPFLFGGVTPGEVLGAFAWLFLIALLSVSFGLAISSKMQSLRVALLVTLLLAVPLSALCYSVFGLGFSVVASEHWPAVPEARPVWLPLAYGRVPLGVEYLVYLVALPLAAVAVPTWFLYEATRSNLTSVTDDRSFGLKRWFVVCTPVVAAAMAVPMLSVGGDDVGTATIGALSVLWFHGLFCAFLFAGEAIGPSRRVQAMLTRAGWWRRALAPGVERATALQLALLTAAMLAVFALGWARAAGAPSTPPEEIRAAIAIVAAYAVGFTVFTVGLAALLRARAETPAAARVVLLVVLFLLVSGPWFVAAIAGVLSRSGDALVVAVPSPIYAFFAAARQHTPEGKELVTVTLALSLSYALLGVWLAILARRRCRRIIARHETVLRDADRRLADEDRAAAEAAASRVAASEAQATG